MQKTSEMCRNIKQIAQCVMNVYIYNTGLEKEETPAIAVIFYDCGSSVSTISYVHNEMRRGGGTQWQYIIMLSARRGKKKKQVPCLGSREIEHIVSMAISMVIPKLMMTCGNQRKESG